MPEEAVHGWEHWIAVAALGFAIVTEGLSAYCIGRERIDAALRQAEPVSTDTFSGVIPLATTSRPIKFRWWYRAWGREGLVATDERIPQRGAGLVSYVANEAVLPYGWNAWATPTLGHALRGMGRLGLALTFTILYALGLPLPWDLPF